MYRVAVVLCLGMALAGCQSVGGGQLPDTKANAEAAAVACRGLAGTMTARARCMNNAENTYLRPGYPYPDLLNLRHSSRVAIASRYDRKEITEEQADAEFDQMAANIQSEASRRSSANALVNAQRSAAIAQTGAALMMLPPQRTQCVTTGPDWARTTSCY